MILDTYDILAIGGGSVGLLLGSLLGIFAGVESRPLLLLVQLAGLVGGVAFVVLLLSHDGV